MQFTDTIPHLNIEVLDNGNIRLENESMGDSYAVDIHPIHLRLLAEKLGLSESSVVQAQTTIATLTRRLHLLRERVAHLAHWLASHSDSQHADLSYEQIYATATADIADEFCAELQGKQACTEAPKQAPERVNPATGTDTRQLSIDALNSTKESDYDNSKEKDSYSCLEAWPVWQPSG